MGDQNWAVSAQLGVLTMLTFDDLVPVVTELNRRHVTVSGKRTDMVPPMAADPDLAVHLVFLAIAAAEAIRRVAGLLAEDAYKGVRSGLLDLLRKARDRDKSRPWNLGLTIGAHHFYFGSPLDDAEFVHSLKAIEQIVRTSRDSLLDGREALPPEPGGAGWSWSAKTGLWTPTPGVKEAMDRDRQK
ncbi:MAG: hypothetical protein LC798_21050 [Chloroflexi bacterium]|nr:hypothetical protein [Chloroflexota bacterium]